MFHCFPFQDLHLLVDTESGAIHTLDSDAYQVARTLEQGTDPLACGLSGEQVEEVLADLKQLRRDGAFQSEPQQAPPIQGGSAVKSLCLHVSHDCNLRCKYCFAAQGDFHGERMLMPFSVAKAALDYLMTASGSRRHLEVDLFGGEPLMNVPVCKQIVAYGRELEQRFNKKINFTITTNCVALNDDVADWINREMHNVVISLDGRKSVHDALRPTANGKGSYDLILQNALQLVAGRGDKEYYVRGTFTRNNLDFTEDVKALRSLGFKQISVEPVVLPEDSPYSLLPEHLPRIYEEYDRLADYYVTARRDPDTWLNFFHFMFDPTGGPCLRKRITGCGAGSEYVAVTPEGDVYPCHQFVGIPEWKLGSVFDGKLDADKQAQFGGCNVCTKETCRGCWAKYYCSGGCLANAYLYGGALHTPHAISCAIMKKRLECAIGIYVKELDK